MTIQNKTTAAILCGGKSSRMGFDKALIRLPNGKPLLLRTIQTLYPLFENIVLITNDKDKFKGIFHDEIHVSIIEDHYIEKGPLGGICTALEIADHSSIFIMAGDMVFPNIALIKKMQLFTQQYDIVLCQQNEKLEPLFGFYSKNCLKVFRNQIQKNDTKIRKKFDCFAVKYIQLGDKYKEAFTNLNSMDDLNYLQ